MRLRSLPAVLALAGGLALAACAEQPSASPTSTATPVHLVQGQETARGTFVGLSNHETSGHGSVFWNGSNWVISLASDFAFDGAPDPVVGFGNNGTFDNNTIIGPLTADTGASVYIVPASIDVGRYNQIYVWCEEFAVPLGAADLTLL